MAIEAGRRAPRARTIRWLGVACAVSLLSSASADAEQAAPESLPPVSEVEAEAGADALREQESEALERAQAEIETEESRGIDADAAAQAASQAEEQAQTSVPWSPPGPDEGAFDWIQTTSGEWLKGDFDRLRDRKVAFDSDEFDDQDLDWKDITYFRFSRPHTFRFVGRRIVWGPAEMRQGVIKVRTSEGVVEFPRNEIVSITRGADGGERDYWSGLLSAGTALRQGNTKQVEFTGRVGIMRETALTRWSLDYNGAFTRVDGNTTTNTHRASSAFDVFLTHRFYVTVPYLDYFSDDNQNIDARITGGLGVGYELIANDWIEADTTLGTGAQHTRFESDNSRDVDAALTYGLDVEIDFAHGTEWDSSYALQLIVTDFGKTNHHAQSVLSFDIWGPLDLDFTFVWDRIESPESQSGSSKPKSDDFRTSVELAIDF